MSRRGNRHDNAVAKSYFESPKRERISRRIYPTDRCADSPLRLHRDVLQP